MCIYRLTFAYGRNEPEFEFHLSQYTMTSGAEKGPCKPRGPGPLTVYCKIL
jgi:hypothetical protein